MFYIFVPIYSCYAHSSCLSGKVFNYTLNKKKKKKALFDDSHKQVKQCIS